MFVITENIMKCPVDLLMCINIRVLGGVLETDMTRKASVMSRSSLKPLAGKMGRVLKQTRPALNPAAARTSKLSE
jgi:hypothetical protein